MNNQEAFDKVARHLLQQKKRSLSINFTCAYRGTDNTRCAIGALIPDELYDSDMEENNIKVLIRDFAHMRKLFEDCSTDLLLDLQSVHDYHSPRDWRRKLYDVAEAYNLNTGALL